MMVTGTGYHDEFFTDPLRVRQIFLQEYTKTENPQWFVWKIFADLNPEFLHDHFQRGARTGNPDALTKSLVAKLMNRLMTRGKTCGLKQKVIRKFLPALIRVRDKYHPQATVSWILLKALVASSPDRVTISGRYGSGVLTRAVCTTVRRRIHLFVKVLTKSCRGRNSPAKLAQQIELALAGSPKSMLMIAKKQQETMAAKANIQ